MVNPSAQPKRGLCGCFGSNEAETPSRPSVTMAAPSQGARQPQVVAQQPRAAQPSASDATGALTITTIEGQDPLEAMQAHFGVSSSLSSPAQATPSTAAAPPQRAPSQPASQPARAPAASSPPRPSNAESSSAADGSIRVVFEDGQDPLQSLMQAITGMGSSSSTTEIAQEEEPDELGQLLSQFTQDGTAEDRTSNAGRTRATLQRHATRMSTTVQEPDVGVRQSTLPRRQSRRVSTGPSAPRRTASRWRSTVAEPVASPQAEEEETVLHALSDDGTGLEVITLADGGMELRLQGHAATEQAEQQLTTIMVEDRTTVQAPTADEERTSTPGDGLRRLDSIVGGGGERDMLGFLRDLRELMALNYLNEKEKKAAEAELQRLRANRDAVAAKVMLSKTERDYDDYRRDIPAGDATKPEVLEKLKELEEQLVQLRFFAELAAITRELVELPPVEESREKAHHLKLKLKELGRLVQAVVLDPKENKPFVAMVKENAEARRETSKAELDRKQQELETELQAIQHQVNCQKFRIRYMSKREDGKLELNLRREALVVDTRVALQQLPVTEWRKRLMIKFQGQEGQDFGGLSRQWIDELAQGVVKSAADSGALTFSNEHQTHYALQPMEKPSEEMLVEMEVLGRVLGLALFHGRTIPSLLDESVFKVILSENLGLDDLAGQDPVLARNLQMLLDMEHVEELEMYFEADTVVQGKHVSHELVPNGGEKLVTDENKEEYINAVLSWRYSNGVMLLVEKLSEGITGFIAMSDIQALSSEAFKLLLCGQSVVNVAEWMRTTIYIEGYTKDSPQVQWLWSYIEKADEKQRSDVLMFTTGSRSVPVSGFGGLQGLHGRNPFVVARVAEVASFPVAHTCLNRLDLPEYETEEELHTKLAYAIAETDGFGII
eukprot:m.166265 g.166265  ORF g.166265 m.166265 type:complete len:896 (+) comp16618_c0_seq3:124-2811(+)